MKKIILLTYFLLQVLVFSATKSLSTIKTLKFSVNEITTVNSKKRELKYSIDFKLPNKIKKEVLYPDLNKGEIYIYDYSKNKKSVYLPIFNEIKENSIDSEENRIISAINKIIVAEKNDKKFREDYQNQKRLLLQIDKNIEIEILDYLNQEDYIFPKIIIIKENNIKVGEVSIGNLVVNKTLENSLFELNKK
ncbi:hypothetical protein [Fusobacterium massiliense]|uniref:hypothetical protein n=1 Tax=Fusobacterium massiliense TaxID=1852365 RepID=UPI00093FAF9D|nr:hypothetical protein [Fusobacterium massiliense]